MSCPHGFVSRDKYTVQYACMEYNVTVNQFVRLMRWKTICYWVFFYDFRCSNVISPPVACTTRSSTPYLTLPPPQKIIIIIIRLTITINIYIYHHASFSVCLQLSSSTPVIWVVTFDCSERSFQSKNLPSKNHEGILFGIWERAVHHSNGPGNGADS